MRRSSFDFDFVSQIKLAKLPFIHCLELPMSAECKYLTLASLEGWLHHLGEILGLPLFNFPKLCDIYSCLRQYVNKLSQKKNILSLFWMYLLKLERENSCKFFHYLPYLLYLHLFLVQRKVQLCKFRVYVEFIQYYTDDFLWS